ncbi:MAG: presqualene diphosphate synthase HpnD [Gammaproteobacteria bacterium]|nr:presqualene diphosphate synthase HpnD [Gammaproteobacteria bacterium]
MTPQEYCQQKTVQSGSNFYYSFLSLPVDKRDAITALYAFCREVDDIVDSRGEAHIKQVKLDWWREEISRLFAGEPQHPVTHALAKHISRFALAQEYFLEILDGMEMDLHANRYQDFKDLALYCHRVAGVVGLLSAEIFGYEDRQTLKYAHNLGVAFQLTNIIRDIYEDSRHDRFYLPQHEMAEFGVTETDIRQRRHTDGFDRMMRFQIKRASEYYERAMALLPDADRHSQRAGIIMAAIYQRLLTEIERDGRKVLEHRIALTPLRKLWIAWRTRRSEDRLHRKLQRRTHHV